MKFSGVPESVKANIETDVSSTPIKTGAQSAASTGDLNSLKSRGVVAGSSIPIKPIGKAAASPALSIGGRGKASASSGAKGKSIVSDDVMEVLTFQDVTFGPHESAIRFRLIHFWEAWNVRTKVLIGLEMLMIDEERNAIQGFIPKGRIDTYLRHMQPGATYKLTKFYGSKSKTVYRVADSDVTVSFSWNSVLTVIDDNSIHFPEDRFRLQGCKEFVAACDSQGDLYDYVGHIKLVDGQVPSASLLLDEAQIAASRRVELHVQTHDDPVLKVYLWDKAALEFVDKFKASGFTARVILITTLNPKRFGGVASVSTTAPSRVFMDSDNEETRYYFSWLNSNLDVASRVNAEVVTKPEKATLGDLFSYMKKASAKVAWFECTATVDDVVHGSGWFYIGCGVCHTKATKGPTTLMCKKCGKNEIVGVPQYLSKLSVYDHKDQAVFVLLGDSGEELIGKKASELVEAYYEANKTVGEDHLVPVPQAMIDAIGQTRRFIVKVSKHNLEGMTQTLTVTKVFPLEAPAADAKLGVNVDEDPDNGGDNHAAESVKRGADGVETDGAKRARCG